MAKVRPGTIIILTKQQERETVKKGCWSSLTLEGIADTVSVDLVMQHDIETLHYQ